MPDVGIEGYDDLPSAVSVSPPPLLLEQLADVAYIAVFEPKVRFEYVSSNVVDLIGWTADDANGVDPRLLVVEVTETAVVSQVALAQDTLGRLRDLGIGVHMDDFGTGHSSISLLCDLPVTGLKLDRRFVDELTEHASDANVLSAGLAGLATGLGLESIAEGIESEEQAHLVHAHGWTQGQGYLFSRPQPLEHWVG